MKRLTIICSLLLMVVFITSCEDEITILPQEPELNNNQTEIQSFETVFDYIKSDNALLLKQLSRTTKQRVSVKQVKPGMQFFNSLEDFPNEFLAKEDFEESPLPSNDAVEILGPLTDTTNNGYFNIGDIQSGISINTNEPKDYNIILASDGILGVESDFILTNNLDGFVLVFTPNVTSVGLNVISIIYNPNASDFRTKIEVYGNSGLLSTSFVQGTPTGVFWGVISEEPIVRIVLRSMGVFEGIDNIMFGPIDSDGDGCYDEDDSVILSDMGDTVNIGGCDSGVTNEIITYMNNTCGYTMNDMINELEAGNYKNNRFLREVEKLTKFWVVKSLISPEEKLLIDNCAANPTISI